MKKRIDIFDKFATDAGYFGALRLNNDSYYCNPELPAHVSHRFVHNDHAIISWSINNYLGLANHPEIKRVAEESIRKYGPSSPMGSRMLTGTTKYHTDLEKRLAEFAQKESAYLFNYGYLGVIGTTCSMLTANDTIVIDKLAHSCMVDGALLSQATVRIFKHNNMDDLEQTLRRINHKRRGGLLIATEGVYGMTGDIAHLREIIALAQRYEARVFVDDAHGWGVMGEKGIGSGEYHSVHDKIDLYFGTFAKAFGAIGGMTATTEAARNWIAFNARTQVFAKALPIIYVHMLNTALDLVRNGSERRAQLWNISHTLKTKLRELGYTIGTGESPICALFLPLRDENPEAVGMRIVKWLREHRVFVSAVVYPVVPRNMIMLRMVPTADHTMEDIELTVEAFTKLKKERNMDIDMSQEERERLARIYNP